jgi:hypothetical protein
MIRKYKKKKSLNFLKKLFWKKMTTQQLQTLLKPVIMNHLLVFDFVDMIIS